jgi:hypothetical protein
MAAWGPVAACRRKPGRHAAAQALHALIGLGVVGRDLQGLAEPDHRGLGVALLGDRRQPQNGGDGLVPTVDGNRDVLALDEGGLVLGIEGENLVRRLEGVLAEPVLEEEIHVGHVPPDLVLRAEHLDGLGDGPEPLHALRTGDALREKHLRGQGLRLHPAPPATRGRDGLDVRRIEGEDAPERLESRGGVVGLFVEAGELAVDADGLGHLPELGERAGEQLERGDVGGRGLETRLQAGEGATGVPPAQVDLGDEAQVLGVVGREVGDAFADLDGLVPTLALVKLLEDDLELVDRLRVVVLAGEGLGEPDAVRDVVGGEFDDLAQQQDAVAVPPLPLVGADDELVLPDGVRCETELDVEFGQLEVGLGVTRVDVEDLLPDGDGLQEEPALAVVDRNPVVGRDRLRDGPLLGEEIADLQPDANVVGVLGHDGLVLLQRTVELALLRVPLGVGDGLVFVDRHLRA